MSPLLLLVALKLLTVLALFNVVPPTDEVVRAALLITPLPVSANTPLEVNETLLLSAAITPVTFTLPVLFTEIAPTPVCAMPAIDNGAPVFVKEIAPPLLLTAVKLEIALAPFKVWPLAEFVVNALPLINPETLSDNAPLVVNETLFAPAAMLPVMLISPVLFNSTSPLPVCEMPVTVRGAAVLVNVIKPPLLLVALKLVTVFVPFKVSPPTELTVNKPPLTKPEPLSATTPVEVNEIAFVPAVMPPVILMSPALFTETLPVPLCEIPVIAKGDAVFTNEILPPLVLVALNVVMVFAPFKVWPPTEVVVKVVPAIAPLSVIALPEIKLTVLKVLIPATSKVCKLV